MFRFFKVIIFLLLPLTWANAQDFSHCYPPNKHLRPDKAFTLYPNGNLIVSSSKERIKSVQASPEKIMAKFKEGAKTEGLVEMEYQGGKPARFTRSTFSAKGSLEQSYSRWFEWSENKCYVTREQNWSPSEKQFELLFDKAFCKEVVDKYQELFGAHSDELETAKQSFNIFLQEKTNALAKEKSFIPVQMKKKTYNLADFPISPQDQTYSLCRTLMPPETPVAGEAEDDKNRNPAAESEEKPKKKKKKKKKSNLTVEQAMEKNQL